MKKKNILWFVVLASIIVGCSASRKSEVALKAVPQNSKEQVAVQDTTDKQSQFQYLFVEGLKQKMLGNLQEAVKYLSGCLELDPNSSAAMYELANIHAENNDFTSASLLLEKAITISPGNKWYKQMLAEIYQQTKKYGQASKLYTELLRQEPDNLDYMYLNAIMLASMGKTNEAIEAYRLMEKKVGLNEQISVAIQQLLTESGKTKEAYAEIKKLIDSNPEEPKYYGLMADLYQSQGDTANALKYYNKILELDPENGFVFFSLANYYQTRGDLEKGFEFTKKGFSSYEIELDTKLQFYFMLTADQKNSNITSEQVDELINILVLHHPDDSRVYLVKAENLLKNNQLSEGREQIRKAIALKNNDFAVHGKLLTIDNELQQWDTLYADSKVALALFPSQPQVYFLYAVACIQLEKYKEANDICEEGLPYVVDDKSLQGQFIMLQGEALYKSKKTDEAFALFDKAIELDPGNYIAMNNYAYYLSLKGTDLDKAERMSGKVIELFPDNSTYLDTHAWVLFKKKNYQLAKFYMETAIKNGGEENPVLLEHYGDILIMLEKKDEAKQYWIKAKEMGGDSSVLNKKITDLKYYESNEQ
jgi:tetratricopeptide (TPR) repeat protein